MDQGLWQTIESFDILHSSHMWIQTILSCGEHCTTMQIGTISRLWLRRRSWRFEIHFWRNIVRFWKSYICYNKLDVQETNFSFAQFNRIRNHFFGCRIEVRWYSLSWFMGSDRCRSWKHASEPYRMERPVVEETWSLFSTSHDSQTQAISESDQWFR